MRYRGKMYTNLVPQLNWPSPASAGMHLRSALPLLLWQSTARTLDTHSRRPLCAERALQASRPVAQEGGNMGGDRRGLRVPAWCLGRVLAPPARRALDQLELVVRDRLPSAASEARLPARGVAACCSSGRRVAQAGRSVGGKRRTCGNRHSRSHTGRDGLLGGARSACRAAAVWNGAGRPGSLPPISRRGPGHGLYQYSVQPDSAVAGFMRLFRVARSWSYGLRPSDHCVQIYTTTRTVELSICGTVDLSSRPGRPVRQPEVFGLVLQAPEIRLSPCRREEM